MLLSGLISLGPYYRGNMSEEQKHAICPNCQTRLSVGLNWGGGGLIRCEGSHVFTLENNELVELIAKGSAPPGYGGVIPTTKAPHINKSLLLHLFLKAYYGLSFEELQGELWEVGAQSKDEKEAAAKACEVLEKRRRAHWQRDPETDKN